MKIDYDVVIVGAGLCGALMAEALATKGFTVLVLEAGTDYKNRNDYLERYYQTSYLKRTPESPYPWHPQAPFPKSDAINDYYVQTGPEHTWFKSTYLRMFGGTTLHWLGTALRMHPHDFELKTRYGVGRDWPLSYSDLLPWYEKAEHMLGVAGTGHQYPMPALPMSYLGNLVKDKVKHDSFEDNPLIVTATPQARNSVNGYQNRPACNGNHSCIPICPIHAKYDALVHLKMATAKGAIIQTESVVNKLEIDSVGHITAVNYLKWDGSTHQVKAKFYILAAHGIEIPKLLLNSRQERSPKGVANHSDQVGRNLMDHPSQLSYALSEEPVYPYRSPMSTSGIESIVDGSFRKTYSSFRMQINDTGWAWPRGNPYSLTQQLIDEGLFGEALNKKIANHATREVSFASLLEMLPDASNRVTLADERDQLGIPRPKLSFKLDEYVFRALAKARALHEFVFNKLGTTERHHFSDEQWAPSGHIMGTTIMGDNPNTSVVNKESQSHDHPNLFILGSSVFPSGACVNPSLTIAALTLKTAQHVIKLLES